MYKQVLWSLDLNTKNNLNGGFHCRHEDVTMEQMKVAYRAMMEDLNRTAKAQDWHCIVIGGVSQIDPSNGTYKAPHIHLLIYGTPCWTVVNHLLSYWTSHGYANSIPCAKKKCTTDGKISYVWAQVPDLPIRRINYGPAYASELFGCIEAENPTNIYNLFLFYWRTLNKRQITSCKPCFVAPTSVSFTVGKVGQ